LRFEGTKRKNRMDYYASREYLKEETMHNHKQSIGLEYTDLNETCFKKLDIELAVPSGFGFENGLPSFAKVEGLYANRYVLIQNKLNIAYQF
jgi:hypothetical protein